VTIIRHVGAARISDVEVSPSPTEVTVTATCRGRDRVAVAHRISQAVAHLWLTELVDPVVPLRVLVDQLDVTVPPGWLLGPLVDVGSWRRAVTLSFRSDA
jgi:hypothetical protein